MSDAPEDPGKGTDVAFEPTPGPTYTIKNQPIWTYFLTPVAVLIGAVLIGAAIFATDDDGDGGADADANVAATLPASLASPAVTQPTAGPQATLLSTFNGYAQGLGLDVGQFQSCLSQQAHVQLITSQLQQGSSLGVNGTPTFFINNKMIVGAQPAAIFNEVIKLELEGPSPTTLDPYSAGVKALAAASPPRFQIVSEPPDVSNAQFEGPSDAKVIIAEFSDFQCPFCKQWFDQTLPGLRSEWESKGVSIAFLHFPLTQIHPNAGNAAVAAICAGEQGEFWGMHDLLFARQKEWESLAQ